jgi:hypothetical protein
MLNVFIQKIYNIINIPSYIRREYNLINYPRPHKFSSPLLQSGPRIKPANPIADPNNIKELQDSVLPYFNGLKRVIGIFLANKLSNFRDLSLSEKEEIREIINNNRNQAMEDFISTDLLNTSCKDYMLELLAMREKMLEGAHFYGDYAFINHVLTHRL